MSSVTSPTTTDSGVGNTTTTSSTSSPAKSSGAQEEGKSTNPETGEPAPGEGIREETAEEILSRITKFVPFTEDTYRCLVERERVDKANAKERASKAQEAHLVDGELIFGAREEEGAEKIPERNPDFREGSVLRDDYGVFPTNLFGKPLEEIDKGIRDKTFIVIAKRFGKKYINRFTATRSFFIFPPWNVVRRVSLYIATHQFFDLFIIFTILVNCVFLAMPTLSWADKAEYVFLGIYIAEMCIKLVARGFFVNSYTYLRDPWNWLDFIVIVSAVVTEVIQAASPGISVGNLTGLRTFRVFRALRTVSIVPGLKTIVNALLRAFKMLFEVIILTVFCLMVFALFALQVYMGALRQKCVADVTGYVSSPSLSYDQYYAQWIRDSNNWQMDGEGDWYQLCGNATGTGSCNANYTCLKDVGDNPNYGYTSFDHFGWAMLTSFQLLTLDFWEDTYNKITRTSGPWNVIFFLVVVFFGSFYLLNLMLAVVAMSYEEEAISAGKEKERDIESEKKKRHNAIYDLTMLTVKSKQASEHAKEEVEKHHQQDKAQGGGATPRSNSTAAGIKRQGSDKTKRPSNSQKITVSPARQQPVNPRKPLVKNASRDSGFSVQSQKSVNKSGGKMLVHQNSREVLRNPEDAETASDGSGEVGKSGTGTVTSHVSFKDSKSVLEYKQKNPLVKQESQGTVSSSGIFLDKDGMSSMSGEDSYREPIIVLAEDLNDEDDSPEGKLVDRNCACCRSCCKCYEPFLRFQNALHSIVADPLFDFTITICIILNTVFLAIEHHDQPAGMTTTLKVANYFFTAVFILEAILKLNALSKLYFHNGWNIFDLVIVIASIVDLASENVDGLSVLRTFRLLRVVKLAQSWATMRILLTIIINTMGALVNLTGVLGIIIYIFAVIGLQLFRENYENFDFEGSEGERWNFKDFFHSFMMVFRILCGEWIEPLWECMRAANELCMVVFLPALVIGNFIVLNLFLALLLNAFASDTIDKHKEEHDTSKMKLAIERIKNLCCCCLPFAKKNTVKPTKDKPNDPDHLITTVIPEMDEEAGEANAKDIQSSPATKGKAANGLTDAGTGTPRTNGMMTADAFKTANKRPALTMVEPSKANASHKTKKTDDAQKAKDGVKKGEEEEKTKKDDDVDEDDLKLGDTAETIKQDSEENDKWKEPPSCFPKWMRKRMNWVDDFNESPHGKRWFKFRSVMLKIVDNRWFEYLILFLIFSSSLTLAFEDIYLYQKTELKLALYVMNIIFCVLFGVEMILKMFAYGLTKYFTRFWTVLDFLIVVISVASLIGESLGVSNITAFRSLRTLRALRPLRAISRWESMKIVVNALMRAIPSIFNVFLVGMVFWLIFSIMGVQFFAGKFYKCVNATTGETLDYSVTPNKTYCLSIGERWQNSKINFDNAGAGFLALFQVATFEGWMEVMQDAVDSTEVDEQPKFENNLYLGYIYFVVFIIVGSFFTLNLFIGVIIDNFNALKKKYDGSSYLDAFLTDSQRKYYNTLKKLGNKKPQKTIKRPKNKFQIFFYNIAMSTKFEMAVVILIFLNMIVMAVEHYKQTDAVEEGLDVMNIIFTTVFGLEAIVKLIGLRWHYFRVPWNIFDFIVVLLSVIGIILQDILSNALINPTLLRVVRVFRIGRVLRLIKAAKGIRKLLFALIISLPAIFNIGALLLLVMYIYAIIGMSSFGDVKLTGRLNDLVNFQTFYKSFLLLIRLATSAGWNDILEPLLIQPPDCNPDYKTLPDGTLEKSTYGDCGIPWLAIPYMVSYIIIIFLIVINMYIAVILENFNQAHQQEEVGITEDDFDMFYVTWERYDPHATQFIKYEQLSDLVADLDDPLKIPKPNEITLISFNLNIVEGDRLHCLDVLMALVNNRLRDVEQTEELQKLKSQMEAKFRAVFPTRETMTVKTTTLQRKKEDVAARTLQRAWRSHKTQKALKNIVTLGMRQNSMRRNSAVSTRERASGLRELGRRLSQALSNFFGSSRPSSAVSRISVGSPPSSPRASNATHLQQLSKQGKLGNTLQVPSVTTLYGQGKAPQDIEL